jgi:hypothetical protein
MCDIADARPRFEPDFFVMTSDAARIFAVTICNVFCVNFLAVRPEFQDRLSRSRPRQHDQELTRRNVRCDTSQSGETTSIREE